MTEQVLVVGASGFVGQALCRTLRARGKRVVSAVRERGRAPAGTQAVGLPDLERPVSPATWADLLAQTPQAMVYLAARVHVMRDTHPDPLAAYRAVNRDAAVSLARAAAERGVRRFVYVSSVKANGEQSARPLREEDLPAPTDVYGLSKLEAEHALLDLGRETGLEVVVIRPPLVYGPGVKANFMALARAAGRGLPLPLGAVRNKRSMVYVDNLADLIAVTLEHPAAPGEVFFASDGEDLSTPELTRRLAEAQGVRPWLPAVPLPLLKVLGRLSGRGDLLQRLTTSLQVSGHKARERLGWTPPYPVWHALARTGRSLAASPPGENRGSPQPDPGVAPHRLNAAQRRYLALRLALERVAALALLLALAPVCLLLAALIRLDSPGPPLFLQERAGRGHRPFRIYKFRTMRVGTPQLSTEDMQRLALNSVTRLGAVLRRTSLDELPQLLNVLRGEMSLIGPRPALLTQTQVLTLRERAGVQHLPPGITGYAQVTGRDDLDDEEKVARDAFYLRHLGPALDLRLLRLTWRSVLKGTGNK